MADQRSSALFKRAEQLKRWEESDTNRTSPTPRTSTKIKFSSGCVFLAACASGDKDEVLRLLKQGADINTANIDGLTALHQACIDDNLDMVEFLVSRGADINRGDNEGWTPLHATASCGFLSIARFLIESGADVAAVNYDGELPVDIAESDQTEQYLQKIIQERGVDTASARAAECRRLVADAERWAESGYCDWRDLGAGGTPLHVAAAKGYMQAARILLERCGVEVDARDADGWTPLHAAVLWGQREAAELLLRHGADIDAKNYAGQTCFDLVEMNMVTWLEERRAALNFRNSNNQTKRIIEKPQLIEELPIKKETPKLPPKPKPEEPKPVSPPSLPLTTSIKEAPKTSPVLSRPQDLAIITPERRENNWITPNTPSVKRSLVPPVRDEESETQRKLHAKRVRETRRSTQGVTLDDIKSAEQIVRRSNGTLATGANAVISPALTASAAVAPVGGATATTPTASALACTVTATLTPVLGERRPSWRLHTQDDATPQATSPTKTAPTTNSNAENTSPTSPVNATSSAESPGDKGTEASTQAALNVIQRRRRPKRRFTGIAHLNINSDGESESVGDTGEEEEDTKDYRALWEAATAEVERLKVLLVNSERQLREAKAIVSQNSLSEMEKREKRAMERKLSEMEEELKFQQSLQAENQRLKNENGALIRVISKLSK